MIQISADRNIYKIEQLKPEQSDLQLYDPEAGLPAVKGSDALIVRTVSRVNAETLRLNGDHRLKFIGTASAGSDHIETDYFREQGLTVEDAGGCNARSVAEYVAVALLLLREDKKGFKTSTVGLIGAGNTGSATAQLLQNLSIPVKLYDPPRENRDPSFRSCSKEEILDCDILSFHVPYKPGGEHPTRHWLNADILENHSFTCIINASRGGVVDELALLKAHIENRVKYYVLDVWENEPDFNPEIAKYAAIATPHIAGYSEQAKVNATAFIMNKMAGKLGIPYELPPSGGGMKHPELAHISYTLGSILRRLHPIMEYDRALRDLAGRPDKTRLFATLRTDWPFRYEFPNQKIRKDLHDRFPELAMLGFRSSNISL